MRSCEGRATEMTLCWWPQAEVTTFSHRTARGSCGQRTRALTSATRTADLALSASDRLSSMEYVRRCRERRKRCAASASCACSLRAAASTSVIRLESRVTGGGCVSFTPLHRCAAGQPSQCSTVEPPTLHLTTAESKVLPALRVDAHLQPVLLLRIQSQGDAGHFASSSNSRQGRYAACTSCPLGGTECAADGPRLRTCSGQRTEANCAGSLSVAEVIANLYRQHPQQHRPTRRACCLNFTPLLCSHELNVSDCYLACVCALSTVCAKMDCQCCECLISMHVGHMGTKVRNSSKTSEICRAPSI